MQCHVAAVNLQPWGGAGGRVAHRLMYGKPTSTVSRFLQSTFVNDTISEAEQSARMEQLISLFFSHPAVEVCTAVVHAGPAHANCACMLL